MKHTVELKESKHNSQRPETVRKHESKMGTATGASIVSSADHQGPSAWVLRVSMPAGQEAIPGESMMRHQREFWQKTNK